MSVEELELNALHRLGLTEYEARIYLVLVNKGGAIKAGVLSFFAQVPREKTYGAINELERKGLVRIFPGKPEVYSAVSPGDVLKPLVSKLARELNDTTTIVESLTSKFEANHVKSDGPKEADGFWEIQGRPGVFSKVTQLIGDASKTVNYCTSATGLVRAYKGHCDMLEKVSKRGVGVHMLSPVDSENAGVAREISEILEFKALDKALGQNFVTVDGRVLVVIESSPEDFRTDQGADRGVWTTNRVMVELHDRLFDRLWNWHS